MRDCSEQNNNMPIATYAPRRKSSLSHITTDEVLPVIEKPKKCYRCDKEMKATSASTSSKRSSSGCKSLLGSMRESLLHGKTSGFQSKPTPFKAMISAGLSKPILMDFEASFYTWSDGSESPYVGTLDMSAKQLNKAGFPGFKVEERGKIQTVICNEEGSVIKIIIVNYNIRKLKSGFKVFIRQSNENYTIHLNFMNCKGRFYLFDDIKVIFNNHLLSSNSKDVKFAGKPSKVNLDYYLKKCYLCDPDQSAITDDENVTKLSDKLSSLEMIKDTSSDYENEKNKENEMNVKFNDEYQMKYIDDDESTTNNDFNENGKREKGLGYNYGNNGFGMLVLGSTEFR